MNLKLSQVIPWILVAVLALVLLLTLDRYSNNNRYTMVTLSEAPISVKLDRKTGRAWVFYAYKGDKAKFQEISTQDWPLGEDAPEE